MKRIMTFAIACAFVAVGCGSDKAKDTNTTVATTTQTTIDSSGAASPPASDGAGAASGGAGAGVAASPSAPASQGAGAGVGFDPSTIARGQRFADLFTEEATLQQAAALPGKPYLGRVRFSGTVDLTGKLVANTSSTGKDTAPCFVPDARSSAKLPRMQGDDKPVTICFFNVDAKEILGQLTPPAPASIRISGYVVSYARDGERNTAALLSVSPPSAQ